MAEGNSWERLCFNCMSVLSAPGEMCPRCGCDNRNRTNGPGCLPATVLNNQYFVGRSLGRGGFGVTYLGYDLNLKRRVAIKEYFPAGLATRSNGGMALNPFSDSSDAFSRGQQRALDEGVIIANMGRIPNVVQVYNAFRANGTVYIVMEYIAGATLNQLVKNAPGGKLDWEYAYKLLRPIMRALDQVHAKGVIHRDVSPDNIILSQDTGDTVLLDFGAAHPYVDTRGGHTQSLRPGFAPVEQYSSRSAQDGRTDEYALCATLYYLITGKIPTDADQLAFTGERLTPPRELGADIPADVQAVLMKGLSDRMDDRYPSMQELERAFDAASAATKQPGADAEFIKTTVLTESSGQSRKRTSAPEGKRTASSPERKRSSSTTSSAEKKRSGGSSTASHKRTASSSDGKRGGSTTSRERGKGAKARTRRRGPVALLVIALVLVAGVGGIMLGRGGQSPAPTQAPATEAPATEAPAAEAPATQPPIAVTPSDIPPSEWPQMSASWCFDSERDSVASVTFTNSLAGAPADASDISASERRAVLAWWTPNGNLYDVTIAGEGGVRAPEDCASLFADLPNLRSVRFNGCFNTASATYMFGMFSGCPKLAEVDLSGMDISHASDISSMFMGCSALTELDLSCFDTSGVTSMAFLFSDCSSLTELDLSAFDTSNVTDMMCMFNNCTSLTALDLSSFDTSSVTSMASMFGFCTSLTVLDLRSFDTSNVEDMSSMFMDCTALAELDLSSFDTSNVTSMGLMFCDCSALEKLDLSSFNTSAVTDMTSMFNDCSSLTELDLSSFDTSSVESMGTMFGFCPALERIDLSSFDTANVTDMSIMFGSCESLAELDLSAFDTSNVANMSCMFQNCRSLTALDLSSFNTAQVEDMSYMFDSCAALAELDLRSFDTSSVANMSWMFYNCAALPELDLTRFDTSQVTDMSCMFCLCTGLKEIRVSPDFVIGEGANTEDMFLEASVSDVTRLNSAPTA